MLTSYRFNTRKIYIFWIYCFLEILFISFLASYLFYFIVYSVSYIYTLHASTSPLEQSVRCYSGMQYIYISTLGVLFNKINIK